MSRHHFTSALLSASLILMPVMASAQLTAENTGLSTAAAGTGLATSCVGTECLLGIIGNVINLALGFLGVILLVMLLYAGFLWMTAGGEKGGVEAAKKMIQNAVAGVIIIAVSYAITAFVLGQLATIVGDSEAGAGTEAPGAGGRGAACRSSSECPTTTCPPGGSSPVGPHAGLCVAGECSAYVCSP